MEDLNAVEYMNKHSLSTEEIESLKALAALSGEEYQDFECFECFFTTYRSVFEANDRHCPMCGSDDVGWQLPF